MIVALGVAVLLVSFLRLLSAPDRVSWSREYFRMALGFVILASTMGKKWMFLSVVADALLILMGLYYLRTIVMKSNQETE
jgi:hypothetical protein